MEDDTNIDKIITPTKYLPQTLLLGTLRNNPEFLDSLWYIDLLRESQYWSPHVLKHIQTERLKQLLSYLSQASSFWSKYFAERGVQPDKIDSFHPLTKLPVLRRKTLVELGELIYVVNPERERSLFTRYTSGTGGLPMKLMFDQLELIVAAIFYRFRHPVFDKIHLKTLFERRFYVSLAIPGDRHVFDRDFTYRTFHPISADDLKSANLRRYIYETIHQTGPALLAGYASLVLTFAQYAKDDRVKLPLVGVRLSSDGISPEHRHYIRDALDAPILNLLSSNGASLLGFECPDNTGYFHVNSERVILEVVDENDNPVNLGEEGELIVTALDHSVTPIIRYSIMDTGRLVPETCRCGRTLPLFEFLGRRGYEVRLPSGQSIKYIHMNQALQFQTPLHDKALQYQIQQNSLKHLTLRIVPKHNFSTSDETTIRTAINALFNGEELEIAINYVANIPPSPGGKPRIFVPLS